MPVELSELFEERKKAHTAILDRKASIETEKREVTADDRAFFDSALDMIRDFNREIELSKLESELKSERQKTPIFRAAHGEQLSQTDIKKLEYRAAFFDYLVNGRPGMDSRSREILKTGMVASSPVTDSRSKFLGSEIADLITRAALQSPESAEYLGKFGESRAQTTTDSAGGFLIPDGFSNEVVEQMKPYGGMRSVARLISTPTGNDIPWPSYNDTAVAAEIIGEGSAANQQDITFASKTLKAYKYSSKYVPVSIELLQDSYFNFEAIISGAFANRFARGTNLSYTTGNGTTAPEGIITATNNTTQLAVTNAISYSDIVRLKYAVNATYRAAPGCQWMFSDTMLRYLITMIDSDGIPLWSPSLQAGEPDTLLGSPYTINYDMGSNLAQSQTNVIMLYGDFSHYVIRDVMPITMMRLEELQAINGLVVFLAWMRTDAKFMSAVSNSGDTPVRGMIPLA